MGNVPPMQQFAGRFVARHISSGNLVTLRRFFSFPDRDNERTFVPGIGVPLQGVCNTLPQGVATQNKPTCNIARRAPWTE